MVIENTDLQKPVRNTASIVLGMVNLRQLFTALLFVIISLQAFTLKALAADLTYQFDKNVDQVVVKVFDSHKSNNMYIIKRFLNNRKANAIPKAQPFTEYLLITGKASLRIVKVTEELELDFADMIGTSDSFVFGASAPQGQKYVFQYQASSNTVEDISNVNVTTQKNNRAYTQFVDNGMVFVSLKDPSTLNFQATKLPGAQPNEVQALYTEPGLELFLQESVEVDSQTVLLGYAYKDNDPLKPFIWVVFHDAKSKVSSVSVKKYQFSNTSLSQVGLIDTRDQRLLIHVITRAERLKPHTDHVLNSDMELIWNRQAKAMTGDYISIAGVCSDKVLILQTGSTKSLLNRLEYGMLDKNNKYSKVRSESIRGSSTLLNTFLQPRDDASVLAYVNFSRTEDERRNNGWYSWEGYQINLVEMNCN